MRRLRAALFVLLAVAPIVVALAAADKSPAVMADAANKFVASLSPGQRQQAVFPFDGDERTHWGFVPTEMFARHGLTIGEMSESQRGLAHALLKSGLSQHGYMTATAIMDLENVLKAIETNGTMRRDPERYFFSVFGTPSPRGAWGWRVEGHHVSLNFTVINGAMVASAPSFFGSNPAEVRSGPKQGTRVLGSEEDSARALMAALDAPRRTKAVINPAAPTDIVTMNSLKADPLAPAGLLASDMTADQRALLMKVVDAYTSFMADDVAAERMDRVRKAGVDKIAFAWAGETERGKKHYYRLQGPTFLIEYDNTQDDGNHIHSVWRDFNGDFGRDLLREHLRSAH
jgi:hypothetical protein